MIGHSTRERTDARAAWVSCEGAALRSDPTGAPTAAAIRPRGYREARVCRPQWPSDGGC